MSVLMYGSEFWHLNTTLSLLSRLESFQTGLGKRASPATTKSYSRTSCSGDSTTDTLREEVFKTISYSDVEELDVPRRPSNAASSSSPTPNQSNSSYNIMSCYEQPKNNSYGSHVMYSGTTTIDNQL